MQFQPWLWRAPLGALCLFEAGATLHWINIMPSYTNFGLWITSFAIIVALEVMLWRVQRSGAKPNPGWWAVPAVISVYGDALGDYLGWYQQYQYFDMALHGFGGLAVGMCVWMLFQSLYSHKLSSGLIGWLVISTTVVFGAVYEIEEYLEDFWTGSHRLGDGPDTANDILMDLLGGVTAWLMMCYVAPRFTKQKR